MSWNKLEQTETSWNHLDRAGINQNGLERDAANKDQHYKELEELVAAWRYNTNNTETFRQTYNNANIQSF